MTFSVAGSIISIRPLASALVQAPSIWLSYAHGAPIRLRIMPRHLGLDIVSSLPSRITIRPACDVRR
jgi:hypothetical protein